MKKFRILPHTADIRIYVIANSYGKLFETSLEALCSILYVNKEKFPHDYRINIAIKSIDVTSLLIDFLNEALTIMYQNKIILNAVTFDELTVRTCKAELSGFKVDNFDEDIKAVTYNDAEIREVSINNYEIVITLDI